MINNLPVKFLKIPENGPHGAPDHRQAGSDRQGVRASELYAEPGVAGAVAHGLAVAADGGDGVRRHVRDGSARSSSRSPSCSHGGAICADAPDDASILKAAEGAFACGTLHSC